jgi:sigma-B regulation protein RsbU (phosphoserine phosphatase)
MGTFLLGLLLGAGAVALLLRRACRERDRLDEEKQLIYQEKQIVVDYMHDMVEALGENLSREELLQRIVHAAILSSGALSACLFERTARDTLRGVAVEGLFPPHRALPPSATVKLTTRAKFIEQILRAEEFPIGEGIVGLVAHTGEAMLVARAGEDPRIVRHDDPALAVHSLIAAPIVFRDHFYGVLCVVNPADGLPFTESDFSLVQALAEQAGMAVHNQGLLRYQMEKRQLDLDLALARNIQQMLLPAAPPAVPGLDIDARYCAAQQVGGDLYDLIPLDGGRLGVVVADVSGKGIPASLLMAICRTNLRQLARQQGSPAATLAAVNRAMSAEMRPGLFVTLVYAVIDPAAGTATIARAGHELPLLAPGDGTRPAEYLGSDGMPVGLVPPEMFDAALVDRTVPFGPADVLVFYTDGVTEAANDADQEFSGARLADVVRNLRGSDAAAINDGILASVQRFTGHDRHRDDLTLVTLRRV